MQKSYDFFDIIYLMNSMTDPSSSQQIEMRILGAKGLKQEIHFVSTPMPNVDKIKNFFCMLKGKQLKQENHTWGGGKIFF